MADRRPAVPRGRRAAHVERTGAPPVVRGQEAGGDHRPTPDFFCPYALDFAFNRDAPNPETWLACFDQYWPGDKETIETLHEWFGYCLAPDTRQQTIAMLIGPTRSGR